MDEHRRHLLLALAFALCLIAGSSSRIVGDGGEYLAQALNFAAFNSPALGRQAIPVIERRIHELEPALSEWSIEQATAAGSDRRRDFIHFWFYALLATPFVWITNALGASPLHAFTAVNLLLTGLALRLALPRIGAAVTVLLFASPFVWWLDKAHTEVFTVTLLTVVMLTLHDRPWWALVAAGAAATQNPPIAAVVLLILGAELVRRRWTALSDPRLIAGAAAGLTLAALQPAYTYVRHGTPSLLLSATLPGVPTVSELAASVLDPSMGLVGNFPIFLVALLASAIWLAVRHTRALATPATFVGVGSAAVFLYAFAQTSNPHHGATPSLTRYALWFIPLSIAIWLPLRDLGGVFVRRALTCAAGVSAVVSVFAFHPGVPQNAREPTWLASWLWTQHPRRNNPLPEVFSETLLHVEGLTVPVATPGCEKILIAGAADQPVWPVPCLPAPVPRFCQAPGVVCYANRRGADYDFAVAPGRAVEPRREAAAAWPREAEPHVRRIYVEAQWDSLAAQPPGRLTVVRAQHDVRVAPFGHNDQFVLVLRPTGPEAVLHFRPEGPLRGRMIDASTGEVLAPLSFDGLPGELWMVPVPGSRDGLILLTMQRGDAPE